MRSQRLLRSNDNPAGYALAELLKKLRLEVEAQAVEAGPEDARGHHYQIAGLLLQAEGLERAKPGARIIEARPSRRHLQEVE